MEADSNGTYVMAALEIRRETDGVVRKHQELWKFHTGGDGAGDFIWSEGNYACDCNRALFYAKAGGEEGDDDRACSDGLFVVRLTGEDGVVLYEDGDW